MNPHVAEAVKPSYERLTTEAFLSYCLKGMTQNANKLLHSQVWQRCPKYLFAWRKRIEVETFSAVTSFTFYHSWWMLTESSHHHKMNSR
ncbi:WD repeat-containing protein 65 [Plakobranchus ocellatus]|uniref:WD repeat-containing protein 65 n=1 Tax=Plakobranchus ocellatus TaxID=259542 RepID=A0AAV4DMT5_9GAST|nr:WD repeat-containing protein 65 [Plakobranchus ocellatus]